MVMNERDEDLALFLEMRRREKEKENNINLLLLNNSEQQLNLLLGSNVKGNGGGGGSPVAKIVSGLPVRKTAAEKFLNSENEKTDYDWLLTPPRTPLFPSLEMESQKARMSKHGMSNARPVALKTRLANRLEEPASRSTLALKQQALSAGVNTSNTLNKRPSSSGLLKSASRPPTPTGRPTLPTTTKTSRSSTPTSRANMPFMKPAVSTARSSTPTRSTTHSMTPTAGHSLAESKLTSRSSTPTRRPASSSISLHASAPSGRSSSVTRSAHTSSVPKSASLTSSLMKSAPATKSVPASSSIAKPASTTSKSTVPSRGTSPTVKSRPWKPSEMPGFSLETPPNLRTSLPERPASASRGRPGALGARSSSVETNSNGRPRRQSCSPARSRASSVSVGNENSIRSVRRADANCNNPTAKLSTSLDSSGFGRTLCKKSLDMAMRHMDIRRTISGSQRPLMTNVPASSIYSSVRSGSTRSRTVSVSDSPLATSSTVSSEQSVNNNSFFIYGSEIDDHDIGSERAS